MSWDSYIPSLMAPLLDKRTGEYTEFVKAAGIIGIENKSVWARSDLFNMTQEEINTLVNHTGSFSSISPSLIGQKYMVLRDELKDETQHNLKLKGKTGEKNNVCISKSKKAFIVVIGLETSVASDVATRAYDTAEYLIKNEM